MNLTYLPNENYFERPQTLEVSKIFSAVTLAEFDAQAKTENIPDTHYKQRCINSAENMAQEFIKASISGRVLQTYFENACGTIDLPYGANMILNVQDKDQNDIHYEAKGLTNVYLHFSSYYPEVVITYESGYQDALSIPENIKMAILKITDCLA